jgi:hypothetical protein
MGKPKNEQRQGGKPATSKYAAKKAAESKGERGPFQFKEGRRPNQLPPEPVHSKPVAIGEERVRATITGFVPGKDHLFLTATRDGGSIYLPLATFERDINPQVRETVKRGWYVVCTVGPAPPGTKYPQATRIISVSPPQK